MELFETHKEKKLIYHNRKCLPSFIRFIEISEFKAKIQIGKIQIARLLKLPLLTFHRIFLMLKSSKVTFQKAEQQEFITVVF